MEKEGAREVEADREEVTGTKALATKSGREHRKGPPAKQAEFSERRSMLMADSRRATCAEWGKVRKTWHKESH